MNVVVLVGRLGKDPDLRYIAGTGKPVTTFSLAVKRAFANKDGQREADFFNIVVWGKQAEACANHLAKGRMACVRGAIQNRSYEAQNGEKRYITEIIADNVEFLGNSSGGSGGSGSSEKTFEPTSDIDGFEALDDDDIPF